MHVKFLFLRPPGHLDSRTTITIGDNVFDVEADDLKSLRVLGRGAYGVVEKVCHIPSNTIMAVKVCFIFNLLFFSHFHPYFIC